MRIAKFDKTVNERNQKIIDEIMGITCPKCQKSATNVRVNDHGRAIFDACCDELSQIIHAKVSC